MPDKSHWIQDARKSMEAKGTIGSFKAAAKRSGMSTHAFAKQKKNAGGAMGKKANFALNAGKR